MLLNSAGICATVISFALIQSIDGVVTFSTTSPVTVAETFTTGTAFTLAASTDLSGGSITTYTLTDTTTTFEVATATSGAVTLVSGKTLDYSTISSYSVGCTASDGTSGKSLALTINIVENVAPAFASATQSKCVLDSISSGDTIGTYAATDADTIAPNSLLAYTIVSGDDSSNFAYAAATGVLTKSATAFTSGTTAYTLKLRASDGGSSAKSLSATTTLSLTVSSTCDSASIISGTLVAMATAILGVSLNKLL